ncbi:diacylglycerol kinase [Streptococcus pneumoniae]|nr:diacylglycerol kinase [Streptococcus pneumoniae]
MDSQDNKRKWKNRDLISSLEFAITGIFTAIKEERNMRKHAVTALVVILAGFGRFWFSGVTNRMALSPIEHFLGGSL